MSTDASDGEEDDEDTQQYYEDFYTSFVAQRLTTWRLSTIKSGLGHHGCLPFGRREHLLNQLAYQLTHETESEASDDDENED